MSKLKITKIEEQKKNKDRVSIYIDEVYAFGVNLELVYLYSLKVGKELTDEFVNEVLKKEESMRANNYAINLISSGGLKTEKEIIDKMTRKGFNEEDIVNAITLLKEYKYIDDNIFAEYFIKDKININGYGVNKIKNELYRKGVSSDIINEALEEFIDSDNQFELALEAGRKKIRTIRTDDFSIIYRRVAGFLQGRGFSFDVIKKVMDEIKKEFKDEQDSCD